MREGTAKFDAIVEEPNAVVDKVEYNAQFALACFWHLCEFAQTHEGSVFDYELHLPDGGTEGNETQALIEAAAVK